MIQILQKWKVEIEIPGSAGRPTTHTYWVHDNFASNVLQTVGHIQFSENGLTQPTRILIELVAAPKQEGLSYT